MAGNKDSEDSSWNTWLVKADAQGNILWERVYTLNTSLNSYEVPTSVKTDVQGNIILLVATSAFEPDYRLLKVSPNGDLIFDKLVKQTAFHYYASALPLAEGGYVVGMILLSDFSQPIRPAILRLDANGDVLWEKTYSFGIYIYGIEAIPNEGFVVVGRKFVDNVFHPWIQKTDLDGNVVWERIYDVDTDGNLQSIVRAPDGSLWAAGDNFYLNTKQVKALVLKLDNSGDEIWRSEFSKGEFTYWIPNNILPEADGSACLFSRFSKSSPTLPVYNSRLRIRMSLAKIDSSGAMIAEQTFGTDSSYPEVYEAAHTADGDVVMCATVRAGTAQQDAWVVKTDCSATVAVDEQQSENPFQISPNPSRSSGQIWLTGNTHSGKKLNLACFEMSGKKLWEKQVMVAGPETQIALPAPPIAGIYLLEITNERREHYSLRITVY